MRELLARLAVFILLSTAAIVPHCVEAQAANMGTDSVFTYLGFSPGMDPDDAIGLIRRRDGTAFDRSWCKLRLVNNAATQECDFSYARHQWGSLQVSLLFRADTAFNRVNTVLVALSVADTLAAEREFNRVVEVWSTSRREIHKGFASSRCEMFAWIDDRDLRTTVKTDCIAARFLGESPRVTVVLVRPSEGH